ncbi:NADPH-dependent FMN reductase [Alkalihalobacillus sp. CinArs1]|uniref:NADPH-dependent FMN reductase n=1 Tax=Alkalihalobacillus sp. CinArs1 TaxID=2995314 RepID=UPI0022DE5CB5|nr:NADPH-dependent FMN reductase [Alkalihalobacillus sp. CinArs1]
MSNVVLIYGGNSLQSRLKGIKDYAESYLKEQSISYESINVIDLPATDLITANFSSSAILDANEKVEKADAVIILSPVYKAAYTGILKTYLDLLPQKGLKGKAVLPLMIGGSFGHLLAIDYALKPVLSSLGATNLLSGAYVIDQHVQRAEGNEFILDEEAKERLKGNLETLVEELNI